MKSAHAFFRLDEIDSLSLRKMLESEFFVANIVNYQDRIHVMVSIIFALRFVQVRLSSVVASNKKKFQPIQR